MKIRMPPEWGVEPVPSQHRILRSIDFFVLWSSLGVGLLVLVAGSLLIPLGLSYALLAIILGTVIGSLLLGLAGNIGSEHGIPTMVSVRPSFGIVGSYLPSVLNVFQLLGWTIFEIIIMAQSTDLISKTLVGFSSFPAWAAFFTIVVALMAIGGPIVVIRQWLEKLAIWLVYGTSIWIIYSIAVSYNLMELFARPGSGGMTFLTALDIVIAMPVSWMPLAADYNRFAIRTRGAFSGTFLGYSLANIWFYALGALLVLSLGTSDIVGAIARLGFGTIALIIILVDETDNAFADVYSAAVSTQNIRSKLKQRHIIAVYSVISLILALLIPIAQYETFLLLIGAAFIPLFGIVLTDYYIVKRRRYSQENSSRMGHVESKALASWLIGALVYYLMSPLSPIYLPSIPEVGASIPSLFASALVYLILSKISRHSP